MSKKASVYQHVYSSSDIVTDEFGAHVVVNHGLGNLYPIAFVYNESGSLGRQVGNVQALVSVDSDTAKAYMGVFGGTPIISVVG